MPVQLHTRLRLVRVVIHGRKVARISGKSLHAAGISSNTVELAVENQWFDVRHMVQHDMAKAIIADYSMEKGLDYLNTAVYYDNWEAVIEVGWSAFCKHTGLTRERVNRHLRELTER